LQGETKAGRKVKAGVKQSRQAAQPSKPTNQNGGGSKRKRDSKKRAHAGTYARPFCYKERTFERKFGGVGKQPNQSKKKNS